MNDKVSIIVPIYKVEAELPHCIQSILNQTYSNLEIILVDDGSPDNCPQICDEYQKKDNRIKVIHKKNGGLSDARNAGYPHVTGEYLTFIDSDDSVSENYIETLYNTMQRENCDIVECNYTKINSIDNIPQNDIKYECKTYETEQALTLLMADKVFRHLVCNKLYKTEHAIKVYFQKGKCHEDAFWTYQIFGQAKKACKINSALYYYLQRDSSIMGQSYSLKRLDGLYAKVEQYKYMCEYFPSLASTAKLSLYSFCLYSYQMALKHLKNEDKKEAVNVILDILRSFNITKSDLVKLNKKQKIWIKLPFKLSGKMRNLLGIGV